jgi:hypothetical protein
MVLSIDLSYTDLQYAFLASGNFFTEQGINSVLMTPIPEIFQYNVSTALQVSFDVKYFNTKLGLYKDASNERIILSSLDPSNLLFPTDSITIPAIDFVAGLQSKNQILSIGALSTIYTNFNQFINEYFANSFGFNTIFGLSGRANYNNGVFDASALINIIHAKTYNNRTHEYIKDLSGSIIIQNINNLINYAVYRNTFHNRSFDTDGSGNYLLSTTPYWKPLLDQSGNIVYQDVSGTYFYVQSNGCLKDIYGNLIPIGDHYYPVYTNNPILDISGNIIYQPVYSIANGFLDGDLIFIENGFQVKLVLDIRNNNIHLNQTGLDNLLSYEEKTNIDQPSSITNGFEKVVNYADNNFIVTTVNVPLLIKLKNF